jgi:hypothetical protein
MSNSRKNGENTAGRAAGGRFAPGNPGRPKGSRNRATIVAQALLDGEAEALTRRAIQMAQFGNMQAMSLCLSRLLPPKRPGDQPLDLGDLPAEPATALGYIIEAVAAGDLLLADAERLAGLYKIKADMAMLSEIEDRLTALEAAR